MDLRRTPPTNNFVDLNADAGRTRRTLHNTQRVQESYGAFPYTNGPANMVAPPPWARDAIFDYLNWQAQLRQQQNRLAQQDFEQSGWADVPRQPWQRLRDRSFAEWQSLHPYTYDGPTNPWMRDRNGIGRR